MSAQMTRRELLAAGAAGGAGLALSGFAPSMLRALATTATCGRLSDIKHVVILIQENRSFDHYLGSHRGVRGFADPNVLKQANGLPVWYQWDNGIQPAYGPPAGYLTPFHINSYSSTGECTNDITHDWVPQHQSWDHGKMDRFLATHIAADRTNGPMTMGYYTRPDLAFYYALADAFTVCDGYHCSVIGPTDPNRLMSMTATIDPAGKHGGPWLQTLLNRTNYLYTLTWPTYPEQLEAHGVSWKVYSDPSGHYGDNVLAYFKNYTNPTLASKAFAPTFYADGTPGTFEADCAAGTLPEVSWVLAPLVDSEHPPAPTVWGEATAAQVLKALTGNASLWAQTALFITHDENGGFFDHVPPPTPPPGTPGEYITTSLHLASPRDAGGIAGPIGLGFRVPLLVCSPFARGGFVSHATFDHTSLLLFLERRFGVEVPNLSAWRRATVGDLTAALNMAAVNTTVPAIAQPSYSDSRVVGSSSDCPTSATSDEIDAGLPTVSPYAVPQPNKLPTQETGTMRVPSGLSCGTTTAGPATAQSSFAAPAAATAMLAGLGVLAARLSHRPAKEHEPADEERSASR